MSSILKLSSLNILNSIGPPARSYHATYYVCGHCLQNRLALPREGRLYSTSYKSVVKRILSQHKKKSKKKGYAEILRVTDVKATQTKMLYGKLKPSHVTAFAEQPGLILGNLNPNLKPKPKSSNDLLEITEKNNNNEGSLSHNSHFSKKIASVLVENKVNVGLKESLENSNSSSDMQLSYNSSISKIMNKIADESKARQESFASFNESTPQSPHNVDVAKLDKGVADKSLQNFASFNENHPQLSHNVEISKVVKKVADENTTSLQNFSNFNKNQPRITLDTLRNDVSMKELLANYLDLRYNDHLLKNNIENVRSTETESYPTGNEVKAGGILTETTSFSPSLPTLKINKVHSKSKKSNLGSKVSSSWKARVRNVKEETVQEKSNAEAAQEEVHELQHTDISYEKSDIGSKLYEENMERTLTRLNKQVKDIHSDILSSFIDVCIHSNMIDTAFKKFKFRRKMSLKDKNNSKLTVDIDMYNALLHGYSNQANWIKVDEILKMMKEDRIDLNPQSYAAVFDCLARFSEINNDVKWILKRTNQYVQAMKSQGADLNDLFHNTILTNDQTEKILKQVQTVLPNFKITPLAPNLDSNCQLLKNLNEPKKPYITPAPEITDEELKKLIDKQIQVEKQMIIEVKAIGSKDLSVEISKWENTLQRWRTALHESFVRSLTTLERENSYHNNYVGLYPYFVSLPPEMFVECMINEIRTFAFEAGFQPSTKFLYRKLGTKIWRQYNVQKRQKTGELDKLERLYGNYCRWYFNATGTAANTRQYWQTILNEEIKGPHIEKSSKMWPPAVRYNIGKFLYNLIFREVKINANIMRKNAKKERFVPAFYLSNESDLYFSSETVKFHPVVNKLFRAANSDKLIFEADQVPMLTPPKPWNTPKNGGYLILDTQYVRPAVGVSVRNKDFTGLDEDLYPTFDSLNQLQAVPWKVNEDMLDVVIKVFNEGGSAELDVPVCPDFTIAKEVIDPGLTQEEKYQKYRERKAIQQKKMNEYGLWCEALYKLSLANHFRKEVLWLPQNMDFRGRVYPVPPHFNHLGADLYRSLLVFAKGKELGPKGLDWLKVHAINLTGTHKKKSIKDRLNRANEILPEILDSAERPLTGNMWWKNADEPWQTLAACMEIKKALDSPDPEKYASHFPVHQDGSCNGLQHYAALGRDSFGARSVNLDVSELPEDVYSVVVQIVEKERKADAESGLPIAQILDGFVTRKVIKQTIMTTVYGVTQYGAKHQIARQLEDLKGFPQEHVWQGARYLTVKTFESLQRMFTSAKEIQDWFIKCAAVITKKKLDYVEWITPLGLPVLQPYAKILPKNKNREIPVITPNHLKQRNAFPPNFVHSLDSSHMMLTSLYCEQSGLTFASIHDCFWTHACTVDAMNRICRQQFVALHSQPILQNLSQFFLQRYSGNKDQEAEDIFKAVPQTGDFKLENVLDSVYFFS